MLALSTQNINGVLDVAGHSSVPEALYWFRKAERIPKCEEIGEGAAITARRAVPPTKPPRSWKCQGATVVIGHAVVAETVRYRYIIGIWAIKKTASQNIKSALFVAITKEG